MKKNLIITGILLCLIISFTLPGFASEGNRFEEEALILKDLGLMKGTSNGFELDREATRLEALVMLIRLIGKEAEALSSNYTHPFIDVPDWGQAYVGYGYEMSLTKGVSPTEFGSNDPVNAYQFFTFLLRALGYDDGAGDFTWDESISKALESGVISQADKTYYEAADTIFLRDDCAGSSFMALKATKKDSEKTMGAFLADQGVFEQDKLQVLGIEVDTEVEKQQEILWQGSIVRVPTTIYNQEISATGQIRQWLVIDKDVLDKAIPGVVSYKNDLWVGNEDTFIEMTESIYKDEVAELFQPGISGGEYVTICLLNQDRGEGIQTLLLYDKYKAMVGYSYLSEGVDLQTSYIEIDTNIPFDMFSIYNETRTYIENHTQNVQMFDPSLVTMDTSGYAKINIEGLSSHFDDLYFVAQAWSMDGYSDAFIASSIDWYALFVRDYGMDKPQFTEDTEISLNISYDNLIVLYDRQGNILGYTIYSP